MTEYTFAGRRIYRQAEEWPAPWENVGITVAEGAPSFRGSPSASATQVLQAHC